MTTGTIQIQTVTDLPTASGSQRINLTGIIAGLSTGSAYTNVYTNLINGDNTFTSPPGTSYLILVPPLSNTHAVKLKGNAGDTGVTINNVNPTIIAMDGSVIFILNAAAAIAAYQVMFI